jgi:PAS domain S-box-containing protein
MRQLIINNKILNQVVQILGIDPRTMVIPINGAIYQKIIREAVGYYQNLSEATFGAISPAMASTLQTIFNVDQFVGLGILYNGELEAAIMLILQKGSPVPSQRFLKALANLAAIAFWRKKADQARLESETRFQQMAELLPQGIFECTPEGQITYANQRAAEMFGYQAFRSSNHFINMFAEEKREMILEIFNAIVAGFPFGQHEFQVARRDGSLFPALIYASAIIRDGQSTGIRGVIVDITELKLVERSLQRSNRFLRATSRCNMALVHATDAQSLFNEICVILVEEIFYSFAWIGLFADDRKLVITPVASAGLKNTHLIPVETNTRSGSSINGLSPLEFLPMLEAIQREEAVLIRDIASDLRCQPIWAEAEATQLKSVISLPLIYSGQVFGGITVYARHANAFAPEEVKVLQEMSSDVAFGIHTLQIRADRDQAIVHLEEVNQKLSEAYDATLLGWSLALELRERETAGHSQRVVRLTLLLAEKMGVPAEKLIDIRWGAYLHDIGKIGIPDSILLKPEPLMDDEWQVMRQHPIYAYRLISSIAFLKNAVNIPYLHHERWDGSGYPLHLKGDEIPLAARIFMVVDVWDALVYDRPYRSAWSAEKTRGYLHENAGILFDPKVVTAFLELLEVEEGNGYEID